VSVAELSAAPVAAGAGAVRVPSLETIGMTKVFGPLVVLDDVSVAAALFADDAPLPALPRMRGRAGRGALERVNLARFCPPGRGGDVRLRGQRAASVGVRSAIFVGRVANPTSRC